MPKAETVEQWRQAVLDQLENLRAQPRQDLERSTMWTNSGLGLGLPGWFVRPEGPPPALKAIDLRVVDNLLSNSVWVSAGAVVSAVRGARVGHIIAVGVLVCRRGWV